MLLKRGRAVHFSLRMRDFLFRCKSFESLEEGQGGGKSPVGLFRHLNLLNLILLGIGVIIGAGIFSLTGMTAGKAAGPAVVYSFMLAALACALAGLCYAEFASMVPVAGSAYSYTYLTMGEFLAWIVGWDLILEYAVGAATVASSWSAYLLKFMHQMGWDFPARWAHSPFSTITVDGEQVQGIMNLPAVVVIAAMSLLLIKGIRESAIFNAVMVAIKLAVVVAFIALGWGYMNAANHEPFLPENTGVFGEFGWSGVLQGAGIVFFAYIGFDAVSTAAQEAKNPRRDVPLGVLLSLLICTVLYCLFAYVLTGLANYKEFTGDDRLAPVSIAIAYTPFSFFTRLIELAILAGYTSVILILLMGQSRIFYSMSRDGLLPKMFSDVHPKFQTPWKSNILLAFGTCLFAGFVPAEIVGEMCSIGTLFAFVLVCVGVIVLRRTKPHLQRRFKVPFVPFVPIAGALMCLALMYGLPWDTWLRLVGWLALGVIIYFCYGRHRSNLNVR